MSKIEANKLKLSPKEFIFEKMLQRVIDIISFRVGEKNQTLSTYIDKQIPERIIADEQRLAQVITNLLSNAVKFTPERGAIMLKAQLKEQKGSLCTISISVSDTGIGISTEQLEGLFNFFQQADTSSSRKFGGTGLGLTISRWIVELMGGSFIVSSELGKGSVFTFTIQAEQVYAGHTIYTAEQSISANTFDAAERQGKIKFEGYRLLLAEDVEINREIVLSLLEPTGVQIDCAVNGVEAVKLYTNNPDSYDMIFMDVQMPELDGYDATRRIRAFENSHFSNARSLENTEEPFHIPIVAMTANVFREDIENCQKAGMDRHIGKPLDINEMIAAMQEYLL
jgi:CheY-like chemotaxis protein